MNSTYHFGCIMEGKYDHGCRINRPMFWFKSAAVWSNQPMFWYKSADVLPKTADVILKKIM